MNRIELRTNEEFGNMRMIEEDGRVLFCGSDVARALGYARPNEAVAGHCKGTLKRRTPTAGGTQEMLFIPEGDVYRLIAHSKLPSADRFERWIFDEVEAITGKEPLSPCNEVFTVRGVECYEKDGVAYLSLEAAARGLGFTTIATSGNEVVRWNTVYKYLCDLGVATSCNGSDYHSMCPDFIPENIFYRLAMKARNETAEKFQAMVADEVIPSIRKHGAYMTPDTIDKMISTPEFGIKLLTALQEEQERRKQLEAKVAADECKVVFADAVAASSTSILVGELAKLLRQNGVPMGQNRLFDWLRTHGFLVKRKGAEWNMPTQYSMEHGLMEIKERVHVDSNGVSVVTKTPKITGKGQTYFINTFLNGGTK